MSASIQEGIFLIGGLVVILAILTLWFLAEIDQDSWGRSWMTEDSARTSVYDWAKDPEFNYLKSEKELAR
jgi:hypothetical protein